MRKNAVTRVAAYIPFSSRSGCVPSQLPWDYLEIVTTLFDIFIYSYELLALEIKSIGCDPIELFALKVKPPGSVKANCYDLLSKQITVAYFQKSYIS